MQETAKRLVESFLASKSKRTHDAYRDDLQDFMAFVKATDMDQAASLLLGRGHGEANALALAWKSAMLDPNRKGLTARHKAGPLASSTVSRRLSALRSLIECANLLGLVPWTLKVRNPKVEPYRDTRGPGKEGVQKLLNEVGKRDDAKGVRDTAIIRLGYDLGPRRFEMVDLDLEHVDLAGSRIALVAKGNPESRWRTLPEETRDALAAWIEARGNAPGPLFTSFDHDPSSRGKRLWGNSIRRMLAKLGTAVEVRVTPHGLRHASATEALDVTGGDVRKVKAHTRHEKVETVMIYDDARRDFAGEVARLVAKGVTHRRRKPEEPKAKDGSAWSS
jgi:integrase/recombinase XerC